MWKGKKVLIWCRDIAAFVASVATVLLFFGIKSKDIHMPLTWPHWLWLVCAAGFYAIPLYSLYATRRSLSVAELELNAEKTRANSLQKQLASEKAHADELQKQLEAQDQPKESDPRIRIEILEKPGDKNAKGAFRSLKLPQTCFLLHNEGGATAYRVRIGEFDVSGVKLGPAKVSFPTQESIATKCEAEVTLKSQSQSFDDSDPSVFLDRICAESMPPLDEVTRHSTILYEDYRGEYEFETAVDVIYRPDTNPLGPMPQFAVRDHRFKKSRKRMQGV